MTQTLGCIGALGCSSCPQAAACSKSKTLGFTFDNPKFEPFTDQPPAGKVIDFADWKTWVIAALAAIVLYQLLFSEQVRTKRSNKRAAFSAERDRFKANMRKIRESK